LLKIEFILIIIAVIAIPSTYGAELFDSDFIVERFVSELRGPTTMTFVGDDLLVLEKNHGTVRLVQNGILLEEPVLELEVAKRAEQGMLGITSVGNTVFIYYTHTEGDDGEDRGNRIVSYTWNENGFSDEKLIKDLPSTPGPLHNGGAMVTGNDGTVYAVIGDLKRKGVLQNFDEGIADDTGVILQIAPEGPYYGMGIRNSFGLAIDPVTGNMWDTENGDIKFDEINFVPRFFNSGWEKIMGPSTELQVATLPGYENYQYDDPEFTWEKPVAPTGLTFVQSEGFKKYENTIFVGACNTGIIYKFELDSARTGFIFNDPALSDKMLNEGEEVQDILFGEGFGCITDLEVGPDGNLYVLSHLFNAIWKISNAVPITPEIKSPSAPAITTDEPLTESAEPNVIWFIIIGAFVAFLVGIFAVIMLAKNKTTKKI